MNTFSNINKEKTKDDFLYSELLALSYFDNNFLNFVLEDRNKYLLNDSVFYNQFLFEIRKYNIIIEKDSVFPINIERDWEYLKDVYYCSINIKKQIPECNTIIIKDDNYLLFDDIIVGGKSKIDAITLYDLENVLGVSKMDMYDFDNMIIDLINLFKQYMKPEFLLHLNYFLDIHKESGIGLSYEQYKNYKVNGLGRRVDVLSKLYYNNIADYCNDVIDYEPAFRDYNLMLSVWNDIKHTKFNKPLLAKIKGTDKKEGFKNLVCKIYGLRDDSFYRFDSKNNVVLLPSKLEYNCDEIIEKYKIDSNKDFYLSLSCGNIEIKIMVVIGKGLYDIEITNKLIENIDYDRF